MEKIKRLKNNLLFHDYSFQNLTRKWGINPAELNEAILETGSLDEIALREYFLKKGVLLSFFGIFHFSVKTLKNYLFFKYSKKRKVNHGFTFIRVPYMNIYPN